METDTIAALPPTPTTPRNAYFSLAPLGGPKRRPSAGVLPAPTPLRRGSVPWTTVAYSPSASLSPGSSPDDDGSTVFRFTSEPTSPQDILAWCASMVEGYSNVRHPLDNFSSCWADGLAFCALLHRCFPEAFDFEALEPRNRAQNLELAFRTADEKARIARLLDVQDMLDMGDHPDSKCVYTYVQSMYRRLRKFVQS